MEVVSSGSQTAVISTEHTLATVTAPGVYVLVVDTNAMVNGDVLELRVKRKVRTGDTTRVAYYATYAHAQGADNNIKLSVPIPSPFEFVATLKQTAGTGRAFPWSVESV